jgi:hypothetical protein
MPPFSASEQAFGLLAQYDPTTNAHPVKLIELPEDGKLYVAQLTNITPEWDASTFYARSLYVTGALREGLANNLRNDWFNYDAVIQRTGYKPEKTQQASEDQEKRKRPRVAVAPQGHVFSFERKPACPCGATATPPHPDDERTLTTPAARIKFSVSQG